MSNRICSVKNCKKKASDGVHLFEAPKKTRMRQQWIEALNLENSKERLKKFLHCCSDHFLPHEMQSHTKRATLRDKYAVPTLNLNLPPRRKVYFPLGTSDKPKIMIPETHIVADESSSDQESYVEALSPDVELIVDEEDRESSQADEESFILPHFLFDEQMASDLNENHLNEVEDPVEEFTELPQEDLVSELSDEELVTEIKEENEEKLVANLSDKKDLLVTSIKKENIEIQSGVADSKELKSIVVRKIINRKVVAKVDPLKEDEVAKKKYNCHQCNLKFFTEQDVQRHIASYHVPNSNSTANSQPVERYQQCLEEYILVKRKYVPRKEKLTEISSNINGVVSYYECTLCCLTNSLLKNIKNHIQSAHRKKLKADALQSEPCQTTKPSDKRLSAIVPIEMYQYDPEMNTKCAACNKCFIKEAALKIHCKWKHSKLYLTCSKCDKTFDFEHALTEHQKECSYQCIACKVFFSTSLELNNHRLHRHNLKLYKCIFCDAGFLNLCFLKIHLQFQHILELGVSEDLEKADELEVTDKRSPTKVKKDTTELVVKRPTGKAEKVLVYICQQCHMKFVTEVGLQKHTESCRVAKIDLNGSAQPDDPYKQYATKFILVKLKYKRQKEKFCEKSMKPEEVTYYECLLCSKANSILENIKKHIQLAHKKALIDKWLISNEVSKSKKDTGSLSPVQSIAKRKALFDDASKDHKFMKAHVLSTPGDLNPKLARTCYMCERVCNTMAELTRHQQIRCTNQCFSCSRYFVNRNILKNHRISVHKMKLYDCSSCDESYMDERFLKIHQQFTHDFAMNAPSSEEEVTELQEELEVEQSNESGTEIEVESAEEHENISTLEEIVKEEPFEEIKQEPMDDYENIEVLEGIVRKETEEPKSIVVQENIKTEVVVKEEVMEEEVVVKEEVMEEEVVVMYNCQQCHLEFVTGIDLKKHNASYHKLKLIPQPECSELDDPYQECTTKFILVKLFHKTRKEKLCEKSLNPEEVCFYECFLCGKTNSMLGNIRDHIKLVHKKEFIIEMLQVDEQVDFDEMADSKNCKTKHYVMCRTCYMCEKTFSTMQDLNLHQQTQCPNQCSVKSCKISFQTRKELNHHRISVHEMKLHKCEFCNDAFEEEIFMKFHQQYTHFMSKKVNVSTSVGGIAENIKVHERIIREEPKSIVGQNADVVVKEEDFAMYNGEELEVSEDLVDNESLTKIQKRSTELIVKRPTGKIRKVVVHNCQQCHMKFVTEIDLQKHVESYHVSISNSIKKPQPQSYDMKRCIAEFILVKLKQHPRKQRLCEELLNPGDVFFYECFMCQMKYSQLESIKNHIQLLHEKTLEKGMLHYKKRRTSSAQIVHNCAGCSKNFKTVRGLVNHCKYIHSAMSKTCDKCERICDTINDLIEHQSTVCPIQCFVCGTHFSTRKEMNDHRLSTHRIKLIKCSFCDDYYEQLRYLRVHQRAMHFLDKKILSNNVTIQKIVTFT